MSKTKRAMFVLILIGVSLTSAEEPSYKRALQGEDAKKAAALSQRIEELWAAGKFAEAVPQAEQLLALRQLTEGDGHWEARDAARMVATLRKVAALPADQRMALAGTPAVAAKAAELHAHGKYIEAEPLYRKTLAILEVVVGPKHSETATVYNNLAINLRAQRRGTESETMFRKAVAVREEVLGPSHPDTATTYVGLAATLDALGRAREAEPLYRKALEAREEALGPKHSDTVRSYHNLAGNLDAQGRAREAEPLLRKVLAIREEVLGPSHLDTAGSCNDLAVNLQYQDRTGDAEELLRRALAIREKVLGLNHLDTAQSYNNLATNLQKQGQTKEAELLHRKALAIREALGPRHPTTAMSYNNLAYNLQVQRRVREAEVLYRKALAICEEVLGPRHRNTATCIHNLARNLEEQGRGREAEVLYRQALAIWEEILGRGHPDTALTRSSLALTLHHQGRVKEAEPLLRQALTSTETMLGPQHTATATSYHNLAFNLQAQGRVREAELLYLQALAICEKVLGPRHLETAPCYMNLATTLQAQGRFRDAEACFRQAKAVFEEVSGPTHPATATCYHNLAFNLRMQGHLKEAELLSRKALAICEKVLRPRHPDTATTLGNLAACLLAQARASEAEPLVRKALAIHKEVLGRNDLHTVFSYNNLAFTLQARGRLSEAEPLWQTSAEGLEASRLRLAASALDKAAAVQILPHFGLASCRARLGRAEEAWAAAEAGLARGLLDDLAAGATLPPDAEAHRRDHERTARLEALDHLLLPLLISEKLDDTDQRRRDELLAERAALDVEASHVAARRSRDAVQSLTEIQERLAPDAAIVFWVDIPKLGDHWGCVVRRRGTPAWVRLRGSGLGGAWTNADDRLPQVLRDDIAKLEPDVGRRARRLAAQRLDPLAPHLAVTDDLPAVHRLIVVPVGVMAGIPVEALTDRYLVSYAPSGSVFARLREKHRPLESPTLLAVGDPNFALPGDPKPPQPPDHGLYLSLVLPGGSAARAGLRPGDVLLRYGGVQLTTGADLKLAEDGDPVPAEVWRDGKTEERRLRPGKLGVVFSNDPPAVAIRQQRERNLLVDARDRSDLQTLPGTRLEVASVAALLPKDSITLLLGSDASEQHLAELAAAGKLKQFRLLHLATHGHVDPTSAAHSSLALARNRLPGIEEQERLRAAGKRPATGVLSVESIADDWDLDADLVVLSACETALGPEGGGEGLLGFSQVLLGRGARSLLLSLWKVDDTATALLMTRFYQNLLGKRDGLKTALPKAEALQEAKRWLRTLPRSEVEKLAGKLADGVVRAGLGPKGPDAPEEGPKPALPAGDAPFAHPRYWAAFILIGDPD